MQRYIAGRLIQVIVSFFALSLIVFFTARLTGDPLDILLPENATQEDYQIMSRYLGLDKPLYVQYGKFIYQMVRGDFGKSLYFKRPVREIILQRFPATLQLGALATLLSLIIALTLGVYAAVRRGSPLDLGARMLAVLGQSLPSFWVGLMLMLVFAVHFRVVPAAGRYGPSSFILPAVTLGYAVAAGIMRLMRSSMLDVLDSEYIKLARIKGVPERVVLWKHAFKNALLPVVTFATIIFVHLLAGTVVTETVFGWPGIGRLVFQSVEWRDFPLVQALVLIFGVMYLAANLMVDILYAYLNPKIRYTR